MLNFCLTSSVSLAGDISVSSGSATVPVASPAAEVVPQGLTEQEIELGKRAMSDMAQLHLKYIKDEALTKKLTLMVNEIGRATPRPKIVYDVTIVDSEEVNAFTFPGGHVFVMKGLLNKVESDDELAGVLGHEIGHNVMFHAIKKMNEYQDISTKLTMVILASLVLSQTKSADAGMFAAQAAQAISMAVLNGYSIQYEKEADAASVQYLEKTHYNPVGMLTFMEKLASQFNVESEKRAGIYQTHPISTERVEALKALLIKDHIPINRRAVTRAKLVQAKESISETGKEKSYRVQYESTLVLSYPGTREGSREASLAANNINWLLDQNIPSYALQMEKIQGKYKMFTGSTLILVLDERDARFNHLTLEQLASQVTDRVRSILWSDGLRL